MHKGIYLMINSRTDEDTGVSCFLGDLECRINKMSFIYRKRN